MTAQQHTIPDSFFSVQVYVGFRIFLLPYNNVGVSNIVFCDIQKVVSMLNKINLKLADCKISKDLYCFSKDFDSGV